MSVPHPGVRSRARSRPVAALPRARAYQSSMSQPLALKCVGPQRGPASASSITGMSEQWWERERSRALELRALRNTLAVLRAEESAAPTLLVWGRLSRLSLVRARAVALGRACTQLGIERRARRAMSAWERLARRSLVRWRALAIAQLCAELLAKGPISREEAASLHLYGY